MKEKILTTIKVQSQDTFSIVAVDLATGEVGSAGASCSLSVMFSHYYKRQ